eukprot:SAG31_NODE_19631_length_596_cov_0.822938_1_plen_111_part_10
MAGTVAARTYSTQDCAPEPVLEETFMGQNRSHGTPARTEDWQHRLQVSLASAAADSKTSVLPMRPHKSSNTVAVLCDQAGAHTVLKRRSGSAALREEMCWLILKHLDLTKA